jgi:transcriptional regulator with XRE-family HTH domain
MAKKKSNPAPPLALTAEAAFGSVLKERRLALGYTQSDLEAITDIGRSYISELESAEKQVCLRSIIRLAFALETGPGELMTRVIERMDAKVVQAMQSQQKSR